MMIPSKALWAIPVVAAVGLLSVAVFGVGETKREVVLPAGTSIVAAMQDEVSTAASRPGTPVELRSVRPIRLDDETEIPEGVVIRGQVSEAEGGGRMGGAPALGLTFSELEVDGESYPIRANPFFVKGKSDTRETVAEIGGGTLAGGILGGVLGGGSGAAKGAVVGAVIGTGVAVATEGDDLVLHSGQKLEIELAAPVTVEFRPAPEAPEEPAS
jgi:hypothetical protein